MTKNLETRATFCMPLWSKGSDKKPNPLDPISFTEEEGEKLKRAITVCKNYEKEKIYKKIQTYDTERTIFYKDEKVEINLIKEADYHLLREKIKNIRGKKQDFNEETKNLWDRKYNKLFFSSLFKWKYLFSNKKQQEYLGKKGNAFYQKRKQLFLGVHGELEETLEKIVNFLDDQIEFSPKLSSSLDPIPFTKEEEPALKLLETIVNLHNKKQDIQEKFQFLEDYQEYSTNNLEPEYEETINENTERNKIYFENCHEFNKKLYEYNKEYDEYLKKYSDPVELKELTARTNELWQNKNDQLEAKKKKFDRETQYLNLNTHMDDREKFNFSIKRRALFAKRHARLLNMLYPVEEKKQNSLQESTYDASASNEAIIYPLEPS